MPWGHVGELRVLPRGGTRSRWPGLLRGRRPAAFSLWSTPSFRGIEPTRRTGQLRTGEFKERCSWTLKRSYFDAVPCQDSAERYPKMDLCCDRSPTSVHELTTGQRIRGFFSSFSFRRDDRGAFSGLAFMHECNDGGRRTAHRNIVACKNDAADLC